MCGGLGLNDVPVNTHIIHRISTFPFPASGQPPHFIQEPQDTVLHNTPLVLKCAAQGDPSPTITWYRGDPPALVSDGHVVNGSLVIPSVVEGVDASRGGIPYHCRASSVQFGTIRSRTATVYYACEFSVLFLAQMSTFLLWQSLVDLLSEKLSHTVLRMHPVYLIKTMWLSTAMCQGLTLLLQ